MSDELEDLARRLRLGAGQELRQEAAAAEELTQLRRLRRRSLADAIRAAMHRGDRVTIRAGGLTLTSALYAVGDDYATMEEDDRFIDIRLATATVEVTSAPLGGTSGRPSAVTFRARLAELEQEGEQVQITTGDGREVCGNVTVVAVDHVAVEDQSGRLSYLPFDLIAVVLSRFPPRTG